MLMILSFREWNMHWDATLHYQRNTTTRIITWWFWRIIIQKENEVCVLYLRVDVCRICTVAKMGGGGGGTRISATIIEEKTRPTKREHNPSLTNQHLIKFVIIVLQIYIMVATTQQVAANFPVEVKSI